MLNITKYKTIHTYTNASKEETQNSFYFCWLYYIKSQIKYP